MKATLQYRLTTPPELEDETPADPADSPSKPMAKPGIGKAIDLTNVHFGV